MGHDEHFPLDADGLDRYLAGRATEPDLAAVHAWIAERPERAAMLASLRVAARPATPAPRALDVDAGWRVAQERMRRRKRWFYEARRRWAVGGALAAGVCIGALGLAVIRGRAALAPREEAQRVYVTHPGQRETITLADGTQFTLAPASRLRVPLAYDVSHRDVYLEGEAYFAIHHDSHHPFAVHAGHVVARDVGTRFAVRAYASDSVVRIAVAEGSVAVAANTLEARDMAVVGPSGAPAISHGVDLEPYIGWRNGTLTFANAPARQVMDELARWYGLRVQLADSALARKTLTASFKDEPVADVIDAIALALGARATWSGRIVVLSSLPPR